MEECRLQSTYQCHKTRSVAEPEIEQRSPDYPINFLSTGCYMTQ